MGITEFAREVASGDLDERRALAQLHEWLQEHHLLKGLMDIDSITELCRFHVNNKSGFLSGGSKADDYSRGVPMIRCRAMAASDRFG
jgi:site-specific recombinase